MANRGRVPEVTGDLAAQKAERIAAGGMPRVLDLFAGCGGLSLGFLASGCQPTAAVELDRNAARSYGTNFHPCDERHAHPRDIALTSPKALSNELGLGDPMAAFDIIVGGPPCQAFARVGRSKLREVASHPEAFRHDPRSLLYINYVNFVDACFPLALVLENVPDMLNFGGRHNIANEICEVLDERGYSCQYTLLNSVHYGVPQMRDRAFIVATRKELHGEFKFPEPTHWMDLPSGYDGSRAVALKLLRQRDMLDPDRFWTDTPKPDPRLPNAVTAESALADLPKIDARAELAAGNLRRGARRFDSPIPYPPVTDPSNYARSMREWPGFEAQEVLLDHVIRYLPRDYKLFARLQPGDQYPEARIHAQSMFEEAVQYLRQQGDAVSEGSPRWRELTAHFIPPYDHRKFPNKWRKMERNKPSRTLLAHLGKDGYSHIHYDSDQARTISVREAARLQSFPDGFRFSGTMNPAFRQIGNAVPPLLAKAIGDALVFALKSGAEKTPRNTKSASLNPLRVESVDAVTL